MNNIILILVALVFMYYIGNAAGYCVREYDMWCSSQAPQTCAGINREYPGCN